MRIIVNTTSLTPPLTGIGWYTFNLLKGLLTSRQVVDVIGAGICRGYNRQRLQNRIIPRKNSSGRNAVFFPGLVDKLIPILPKFRKIRQALQRNTFRRVVKQAGDYIYWEPNYILQPFPGVALATIHDFSHLRYPEHHPAGRLAHLNNNLDESIERAERLIVVSDFTRSEVKEIFGVPDQLISVVPPGVAPEFHPRSEQEILAVLNRYHIKPGYVLSVGTLEPRKNMTGLLRAWLRLPGALRKRHPLVLVGSRGWQTDNTDKELSAAELRGEVVRLGYVRQEDLPGLYCGAILSAYLSFYEGFGMPVAEAMASGSAVLTSDQASMPEVAGQAALLVNPADGDAIVEGLRNLLEDDTLRERLAKLGLQRAAHYTWERSLNNLLDAFRMATA